MADEDVPGFAEDSADFSIFDEIDEEEEERAIAEAEADFAAGRVISNDAVMRWIRSWGTENELPPPECGE